MGPKKMRKEFPMKTLDYKKRWPLYGGVIARLERAKALVQERESRVQEGIQPQYLRGHILICNQGPKM
jgi:hypothetical protein